MKSYLLLFLPVIFLLQSCAPHSPAARPDQTNQALQLQKHPEYSNVFIRRYPTTFASALTMRVILNNESIGDLKNESYVNFKVSPGQHAFTIGLAEKNFITTFKHDFKPNEVLLIECTYETMYKDEVLNVIGYKNLTQRGNYVFPCWIEKSPGK